MAIILKWFNRSLFFRFPLFTTSAKKLCTLISIIWTYLGKKYILPASAFDRATKRNYDFNHQTIIVSAMGQTITQSSRATLLDIFRIILCVGVAFHHFIPIRPASGPFMVLGFFVMSGFLLGVQFEKTDKLDVSRFYSGRLSRLLPMFLVAMIIGFVVKALLVFAKPEVHSLIPTWELTEWTNLNIAKLIGFYNAPLWFMGIIFFMLLCAPILFWVYKKKYAIYGLLIICALTSWGLYQQVPYSSDHGCGLYYSPLARSWQFVAGLAAAKIYAHFSLKNISFLRIANIICILLIAIFLAGGAWSMMVKQAADLHFWNYTFDFDFIVVCMYSVLIPLIFSRNWKINEKVARLLSYLALLTYPIYLFHVPIYITFSGVLNRLNIDNNLICILITMVITIFVSDIAMRVQKRYFH